MFECDVRFYNNETLIKVKDRLDSITALELDAVIPYIDYDIPVRFDCKELDYVSSSGLQCFLKLKKRMGDVVIVLDSVNEYVKEVFDLAGMSPYFKFK